MDLEAGLGEIGFYGVNVAGIKTQDRSDGLQHLRVPHGLVFVHQAVSQPR